MRTVFHNLSLFAYGQLATMNNHTPIQMTKFDVLGEGLNFIVVSNGDWIEQIYLSSGGQFVGTQLS